jgi:hypothetical protein
MLFDATSLSDFGFLRLFSVSIGLLGFRFRIGSFVIGIFFRLDVYHAMLDVSNSVQLFSKIQRNFGVIEVRIHTFEVGKVALE